MAKGISLHIGLNRVDPDKYKLYEWRRGGDSVIVVDEGDPDKDPDPANFRTMDIPDSQWFRIGWVGPLKSCEYDAEDMCAIARSRGFETTLLKTEEATSARVMEEIEKAAATLEAGDVFLLTYAGHGSQVDDRNHDERDGKDETWCLYDRMLLDDERQVALAKFVADVRIVVVVDGCHSGTTMDLDDGATLRGPAEAAVASAVTRSACSGTRTMPRDVAGAVYEAKKKEYDEIQDALPRPRPRLNASVLLISACKDDELAGDGKRNGHFTEALKTVWAQGKFDGDYRDFHVQITHELETDYEEAVARAGGDATKVNKQTPSLRPDLDSADGDSALAAFARQNPFSI